MVAPAQENEPLLLSSSATEQFTCFVMFLLLSSSGASLNYDAHRKALFAERARDILSRRGHLALEYISVSEIVSIFSLIMVETRNVEISEAIQLLDSKLEKLFSIQNSNSDPMSSQILAELQLEQLIDLVSPGFLKNQNSQYTDFKMLVERYSRHIKELEQIYPVIQGASRWVENVLLQLQMLDPQPSRLPPMPRVDF